MSASLEAAGWRVGTGISAHHLALCPCGQHARPSISLRAIPNIARTF